jgi:hypothetical protein
MVIQCQGYIPESDNGYLAHHEQILYGKNVTEKAKLDK